MALVIDTAAIVSLAFADEDHAYAGAVAEAVAVEGAVVPTLFWYEVRNVLLIGERRGRITSGQTQAFLEDLALLPFEVDGLMQESEVLNFARQHTLTVYDAAYLELAERRHTAIATVDQALIRGAKAVGVTVWQIPAQGDEGVGTGIAVLGGCAASSV